MRVASKVYFTRPLGTAPEPSVCGRSQINHLGLGFKQSSLDHASLALTLRRYDDFAASGLAPVMLWSLEPFGVRLDWRA